MAPRILSLCSGLGGLDLAVEAALGARVVAHCENAEAPSRVLAAHWPGVPNLHDVTAVDWAVARVRFRPDIITAGYPCQPFSQAGPRKGVDDDRHLWPYIAEAVRRVRPRLVVLENVAGHRSLGFDQVLGDLAALGYVGAWGSVRAADVGAAHQRERVFILAADPAGARSQGGRLEPARRESDRGADADPERGGCDGGARDEGRGPGRRAAAARADGLARRWRQFAPAVERWSAVLGRPAPFPPVELGSRGGRRLSVPFVEWLMGLPEGWVADVPGVEHPDAIMMLGNGVVPLQAQHAIDELLEILP